MCIHVRGELCIQYEIQGWKEHKNLGKEQKDRTAL